MKQHKSNIQNPKSNISKISKNIKMPPGPGTGPGPGPGGIFIFFFWNFGNFRFWILDVGFLVFHDGFLISDVGFLILKFCIFLDFWILCIKIPYPLWGFPQGLFFSGKMTYIPKKVHVLCVFNWYLYILPPPPPSAICFKQLFISKWRRIVPFVSDRSFRLPPFWNEQLRFPLCCAVSPLLCCVPSVVLCPLGRML